MAFQELKQRQSVMWGNGPYQRITDTITDIHELVEVALEQEREGSIDPLSPAQLAAIARSRAYPSSR